MARHKFKPGDPKPVTSGRQKGAPNKKTQLLAEIFEAFDMCVPEQLIKAINQLEDPKDKADVLLKLLEFLYPKRRPVDQLGNDSPTVQIQSVTNVIQGENKELVQEFKDILVDYPDERKKLPAP